MKGCVSTFYHAMQLNLMCMDAMYVYVFIPQNKIQYDFKLGHRTYKKPNYSFTK